MPTKADIFVVTLETCQYLSRFPEFIYRKLYIISCTALMLYRFIIL